MKFFLFLLHVLPLSLSVAGQGRLPAFRIGMADGQYFSSRDYHLNKPLLFVYFDPQCGECRTFTRLMKEYQPVFQKYLVLMVTNTDLKGLKEFAGDFNLRNQKSLILGTEGWTRSLQRTLGISRFPYVGIYDKQWQLVQQLTAPTPEAQFEQLKATLRVQNLK